MFLISRLSVGESLPLFSLQEKIVRAAEIIVLKKLHFVFKKYLVFKFLCSRLYEYNFITKYFLPSLEETEILRIVLYKNLSDCLFLNL